MVSAGALEHGRQRLKIWALALLWPHWVNGTDQIRAAGIETTAPALPIGREVDRSIYHGQMPLQSNLVGGTILASRLSEPMSLL